MRYCSDGNTNGNHRPLLALKMCQCAFEINSSNPPVLPLLTSFTAPQKESHMFAWIVWDATYGPQPSQRKTAITARVLKPSTETTSITYTARMSILSSYQNDWLSFSLKKKLYCGFKPLMKLTLLLPELRIYTVRPSQSQHFPCFGAKKKKNSIS